MSVKRYNSEIEESKTGGWVAYTEYATLEAERDALRQRCEAFHEYSVSLVDILDENVNGWEFDERLKPYPAALAAQPKEVGK